MRKSYDDYAQYNHNCTLSFALASMMFDLWTHVVVYERVPGFGLRHLGGGHPFDLIRRFGDREVERSSIVDSVLRIVVKASIS